MTYRGTHEAPGRQDAPLYDLTHNDVYPPDVYQHPEWYLAGHPSDWDAWGVIERTYFKPDRRVSIYRAVPKGTRYINPGDWVAITKRYAIDHTYHLEPGDVVISKRVHARDLFTNGDSIQEWGYAGHAPVRATVVYRRPRELTEEQKIARLHARQRKRAIERTKGWRF